MDFDEYRDYHAAVGRFAVNWAILESELDLLILSARRHDVVAINRPFDEPYNLAAKIKRARWRIANIPAMNLVRSRANLLLDGISGYRPYDMTLFMGRCLKDRQESSLPAFFSRVDRGGSPATGDNGRNRRFG